jgi:PAS domain S-box-containing protein
LNLPQVDGQIRDRNVNDLNAALNIARSLLDIPFAGLIFRDGRVIFSGKSEKLPSFPEKLSYSDFASSSFIDLNNTLKTPSFLVDYPFLSCCSITPLSQRDASLFFLDDTDSLLGGNKTRVEERTQQIVDLFLALLPLGSSSSDINKEMISYEDLLKVNNNIPVYIALINQALCYEFVNDAYEQHFSLSKENILGMHLKEHIPVESHRDIQEKLEKALNGKRVDFSYQVRRKKDDDLRFVEASYIPRFQYGEVTGLYLCMQDVTPKRRTLNTLKRLHEVTANTSMPLDEKLQNILQVGVEQFSLPFGLISFIKDDVYEVKYSCTPNDEVLPGAVFDLGNTYCVHTLHSDAPTSFFHTGASHIKEHPCYQAFGLEAYIGIVICVNGERWGTLNFSSPTPKSEPFGDDDYEIMKLLSQWVGNEITRHADEVSLKFAERQQRLILEAVHEGIVGINNDGQITFANSAAHSILSFSSDEFIGKHLLDVISHRDKDGIPYDDDNSPFNKTLLNGEQHQANGEFFCDKNGVSFACEYTIIAIRSESGAIEGAVVSFQDRTEQIVIENEVREQKAFFESLFMEAPEAIVLVGKSREIEMINPAFTKLFGYSLDDVKGKSTQILYAKESEFDTRTQAFSIDPQDILNRHRIRYKNKRGEAFYAETIGNMIRSPDGGLGGYIGHIRDVSKRLEVEQKMIDTNLRLSIATDAAGIGVWELDLRDDTLHWDDWMYRLYGFNKEERKPPHQVWADCVNPEDRKRLKNAFVNLGKEGGYFTNTENTSYQSNNLDTDFRIIRQDGQLRYLKSNATLIVDNTGQPSHIVGVNMDVTSRKETEVILREASDQAIAASKAKSNFLATMSHEIRTPLNGVLGMAELLADTNLDLEQRQNLEILRESGEGLLELINGILDFSKIEAGHLAIEREDFNLEKAIYDVARLLMLRAEEKGIDLLVEFDDSCPRFVVGDGFRIKQVLTNLVSNAIKFTHTGHVLLSTKGVMNSQGMAFITISVIDTGVGIADDVQPYLFNAFVQADSSTTRKFGGTGLGLAITKQLTGLMGGEISLSSELGIGSTFTVTLSLPESHAISNIEKMDHEALLIGKKTLVIDDNETNLTILKNQLKSCDIHADIEINSVDGLSRIEQAITRGMPYQIIVLDYMMPELDGLMLSKLIRNLRGSLYQPTILMTSSADFLSEEALSSAGVNVCIPKPMRGSVLKQGLIDAVSSDLLGHQISYTEWSDVNSEYDENDKAAHDSNTKRGLILVVEDMKANMAVACGILRKLGFDIIEAENGSLGVGMWEAHQPDLIFMDLHMPVMDGLSAMRSIRQAEKNSPNKRVPILALTADVQQETLSEVFRAGGDGLIPKPFKQKEFIDMLNKWLPDNKQSEHDADAQMNASSNSVFDVSSDIVIEESILKELKQLLGDDFTLLVDAFFGDADQITSSLNDLLNTPDSLDYKKVSQLCHSLKSITQNVGAIALSSMATQLEKESREGQISNFPAKIQELVTMYEQVKNELQRIVTEL